MHVAPTVPRGTRGKLPGRFLLGRLRSSTHSTLVRQNILRG